MTESIPHAASRPARAPSRAGRVVTWVLFPALNALSLLLAATLWRLRWSGRLADEVDAPEIVLLLAVATGAVLVVTLILGALAVRLRWLASWWLGVPAFILVAAAIGLLSLAGTL